MSSDLETLMGDESTHTIVRPKSLNVNVRRLGIEVELTIGNCDPIRMAWREAIRMGDRFFVEGSRAYRNKRPAELRIGHNLLSTSGRTLLTIGQWLMAKGTEAKFLDGFGGKVIETR